MSILSMLAADDVEAAAAAVVLDAIDIVIVAIPDMLDISILQRYKYF